LTAPRLQSLEQVWGEFWVSLASLLRSYTAVHGLNGNRQATVELIVEQDEDRILARHGNAWLDLRRAGATVSWKREDGRSGSLELTEAGRLRSDRLENGGEEEMDMAAERWARELMQ
jgi:hypothetical protein